MATMLMRKEPFQAAILGMEREGKWLLWKEKLPLNSTLQKNGNGRLVYQSYDSAACACEPPEQGELAVDAAKWQGDQEELATLWSAMRAYQNHKGKLPVSLAELTRPFPENWIGGTTPVMKRDFNSLKEVATAKALGIPEVAEEPPSSIVEAGMGIPTALSESGSNGKGVPFFDQPLRVIVDKQKHRLAVVSGSVILRNYEVGLGETRLQKATSSLQIKWSIQTVMIMGSSEAADYNFQIVITLFMAPMSQKVSARMNPLAVFG